MRNDSIERSVNDSMLTIAESILQIIEQSKQKSLDKTSLMNKEKNVGNKIPLLGQAKRRQRLSMSYITP
ncbi:MULTISPECIES: hypothetical protein [unclassified Peribacillus]|uniref:hypothetical protein n=1 Tax=unclassified Peribacillus TaxID=2675266 RepID=UPI001F4D5897|nr:MULTISPECIES: hypothetical protein [unclassified Peribacillus]MCK1986011.1 hypothetical protein [Peribacillus sp. Aquil_B1]MCK2011234.1 hypothetical protein [Peribacillus sp. Aquil_B8]